MIYRWNTIFFHVTPAIQNNLNKTMNIFIQHSLSLGVLFVICPATYGSFCPCWATCSLCLMTYIKTLSLKPVVYTSNAHPCRNVQYEPWVKCHRRQLSSSSCLYSACSRSFSFLALIEGSRQKHHIQPCPAGIQEAINRKKKTSSLNPSWCKVSSSAL